MSGKNGPAHSIHLTSPHPVTVLLRRLVDMLGICVCLCAVFAHVLSQEAEEPVSITVSKRTFFSTCQSVFNTAWHMHAAQFFSFTDVQLESSWKDTKQCVVVCPSQCTEGYEYDRVREQCKGEKLHIYVAFYTPVFKKKTFFHVSLMQVVLYPNTIIA